MISCKDGYLYSLKEELFYELFFSSKISSDREILAELQFVKNAGQIHLSPVCSQEYSEYVSEEEYHNNREIAEKNKKKPERQQFVKRKDLVVGTYYVGQRNSIYLGEIDNIPYWLSMNCFTDCYASNSRRIDQTQLEKQFELRNFQFGFDIRPIWKDKTIKNYYSYCGINRDDSRSFRPDLFKNHSYEKIDDDIIEKIKVSIINSTKQLSGK